MNETLKLKSINEILDKEFFIPSYQRGYRWGKKQITDLLDDILEFSDKKKTDDEFYCLQPVVVLPQVYKDKIRYRVIDGQQRLTTIFLILKLFNEIEFKRPKNIYTLTFETRPESQEYLNNISIKQDSIKNIDFYYFSNSFKYIYNWFDEKLNLESDFIQKFYPILLNDIKIIWYMIKNDKDNEIDIFTRLNIGKIPLTNSELIKALFLLNIKDESEKILLASQWDEIEYKMQNKNFFAFLHNNKFTKATKIEFIFDVIAKSKDISIENIDKKDDKYSYYIFNELINTDEGYKKLWGEVKTIFRIFNELYNNNVYYHFVGFLTQNKIDITIIIELFIKNNKIIFKEKLEEMVRKLINIGDKVLKSKDDNTLDLELKYGNKKDELIISKILFLHNIISTMKSNYTRYPFDEHKKGQWSLEHIHAQNSEDISKDEDKKILLEDERQYVSEELKNKIDKILKNKELNNDKFEKLQDEIFKIYGDNIDLHTIDNLALLRRDDNSSLNNSIFPSKRDKIKNLDKYGSFIPLCTKNIFLKYYSDNVTESVKWNEVDREAYLKDIKNTIGKYIGENQND